jgi:hypothetical protein
MVKKAKSAKVVAVEPAWVTARDLTRGLKQLLLLVMNAKRLGRDEMFRGVLVCRLPDYAKGLHLLATDGHRMVAAALPEPLVRPWSIPVCTTPGAKGVWLSEEAVRAILSILAALPGIRITREIRAEVTPETFALHYEGGGSLVSVPRVVEIEKAYPDPTNLLTPALFEAKKVIQLNSKYLREAAEAAIAQGATGVIFQVTDDFSPALLTHDHADGFSVIMPMRL